MLFRLVDLPVIEQDKSYYLVKPLWKDTIDSIP